MASQANQGAETAPGPTELQGAGLHITVRLGRGSGPTRLSAFDAALRQAGVSDRNLITLSSVIPARSIVERTISAADAECPGRWGDRLYVVMADERVERRHEEAWAGVGWRQARGSGEGLLVEHHGHSRHQVETDLLSSLETITCHRTPRDWEPPQIALIGTVCEDEPVCALAVAVFQADPWSDDLIDLREGVSRAGLAGGDLPS